MGAKACRDFSRRHFVSVRDEFARIANGRSNPVELEANPLSKAARQSFLNGVRQINGSRIDAELWVVLVDDGDEFDS